LKYGEFIVFQGFRFLGATLQAALDGTRTESICRNLVRYAHDFAGYYALVKVGSWLGAAGFASCAE
jgi:hypothetical protein